MFPTWINHFLRGSKSPKDFSWRNFSRGGFKFFCMERKNLGWVFGFSGKKTWSKLKKFSEMEGFWPQTSPSGYAPAFSTTANSVKILKFSEKFNQIYNKSHLNCGTDLVFLISRDLICSNVICKRPINPEKSQ